MKLMLMLKTEPQLRYYCFFFLIIVIVVACLFYEQAKVDKKHSKEEGTSKSRQASTCK